MERRVRREVSDGKRKATHVVDAGDLAEKK